MSDCVRQQRYRRRGGFIAALLFAGVAWIALLPWYGWVEVHQQLVYDLGEGQRWEPCEWRRYLNKETERLAEVGQDVPSLHITTEVASESGRFSVLDIRHRVRRGSLEAIKAEGMISRYFFCFQQDKDKAARLADQADMTAEKMSEDLRQARRRLKFCREQLEEIKQQQERTKAEILLWEKKLRRDIPLSQDSEYEAYIKPKLEQEWESDANLRQLQAQLSLDRRTLAELDVRAGQSTSASALGKLDHQRIRRDIELNKLCRLIEERKEQLKKDVEQRNRAIYDEYIQRMLFEKREYLKCLQVPYNSAMNDIKRAQKNVDLQEQMLPGASSPDAVGFHKNLLRPQVREGKTTRKYLYWRYAVLLSLGLGLIGWVAGRGIGSRWYHRRRMESSEFFDQALTEADLQSFQGCGIEEALAPEDLPFEADAITIGSRPVVTEEQIVGAPLINLEEEVEENESFSKLMESPVEESTNPKITGTSESAPVEFFGPTPQENIRAMREKTACPILLFAAEPPEEGSPRRMVNLAIQLVREGLKVLLIDTEPASGDLAAIFELPQGPGFLDWRRGDAWLNHVAKPAALAGLTVMGAGSSDVSQVRQEDISREIHRWDILRTRFDVVLLYAPAALAPQPQTDAELLGAQLRSVTDGVYIQVRNPINTIELTERTEQLLKHYQVKLLGLLSLAT
ncbi:MAG: hypothetical protein JW709_08260 [Sedimentisphaerales bacterium]|nr:hypothetical protein [Sedimentisphaerales bacterium]